MTLYFGLLFVIWIAETHGSVNLALNKQAFQTDTADNNYASLAVDGNPSYDFNDGTCTRTLTNDASWEVDLGDVYNVSSVEIYNRIDCCSKDLRDIMVYSGLTRETYQLVGSLPGPAPLVVLYNPTTPPQIRWLKVSRALGRRDPLTLCEVKVLQAEVTDSNDDGDSGDSGEQTSCGANSRYSVDATKQGTGVVITTRVAKSKIVCSVQCRLTTGCQSAIYNHDNSECLLLQSSDYVANTNDNTVMLSPTQ